MSHPPRNPGGLGIGWVQRRVAVDLTATEYAVLYQMAAHAPRVLNH